MKISLRDWQQDSLANNLKRAEVVNQNAISVGLITRQEYACKGGRGVTLKVYAKLRNGVDTTYVFSSSINGGDLTRANEQAAIKNGLDVLSQYLDKHGVPTYTYTASFTRIDAKSQKVWWIIRNDGKMVCCSLQEADAKADAERMTKDQSELSWV